MDVVYRPIIMRLLIGTALGVFASCAGAKRYSAIHLHEVNTIAIGQEGGSLADMIANSLRNRGFDVIDSTEFRDLLVRLGLSGVDVTSHEGITKLAGEGVDAYVIVRDRSDARGRLQTVTAKMFSTRESGMVLATVGWEETRGGPGFPPDWPVGEIDLNLVATRIVDMLTGQLSQEFGRSATGSPPGRPCDPAQKDGAT